MKALDKFYTPNLTGTQRATLKRAYRALQSKRRGRLHQFSFVWMRLSKRVFVHCNYRKAATHSAWIRQGRRVKPAGNPRFAISTVHRFYIGTRGGIFIRRRGRTIYKGISEL